MTKTLITGAVLGLFSVVNASAQLSFTATVELAQRNSPRVRIAESDVAHARAALSEARDAFIPNLVGNSSALGYSQGFPLGTPTIFSFSSQSLIFSYSQKDYIRSANLGLLASNLALKDVREQVAEDAAITYVALSAAQEQHAAFMQQRTHAQRLEAIVKDRLDVGQDTAMEYSRARRNTVQISLQLLQLDDEIVSYSDHLARMTGLSGTQVVPLPGSIPPLPTISAMSTTLPAVDTPAVESAFANARSKQEQAFGDSRYIFRPQVTFGAQYSRFSTYNNNYSLYYPGIQNQPNALGLAVDIILPVFDQSRKSKARESLADALHAEHEAAYARDQSREARLKLQHSTAELAAHAELAAIDQDLAQQQLDVLLLQLKAVPGPNTVPLTPKDEQNSRIQERQRFIDVIQANLQLHQAQISLLRQTGQLASWLLSTPPTPSSTLKTVP